MTLSNHGWNYGFGNDERSVQVDIYNLPELLGGHFAHGYALDYPRVVYEYIYYADFFFYFFDEFVYGLFVRYVANVVVCFYALLFICGNALFDEVFVY